jgi:linoleate 10R-lipoxygenase
MTVDQLAYNVFGLIVASVANWAMAATHVINFYLDDERADQKRRIERLAKDPSPPRPRSSSRGMRGRR